MGLFSQETNKLIWINNGEKLVIEPWGKNSLRVRAAMMRDILDTDFALLPAEECHAEILIGWRSLFNKWKD